MEVYLEEHPPARRQFRVKRRAEVTGAVVLHTAENLTDVRPPDTGAEAVARFISRRTDAAGSYHSVVDSDSIVRVGRYEWEMFHEGTGGNRWSLGLSFACQASQWPSLPDGWFEGALRQGAKEAASMAAWVKSERGITVPAVRISKTEYRAGKPGFTTHAELDPGRRSDPGRGFPWERFLEYYKQANGGALLPPQHTLTPQQVANLMEEQRILAQHAGYKGAIDALPGPMHLAAVHWLKNHMVDQSSTAKDLLELSERQQAAIARLEDQLAEAPEPGADDADDAASFRSLMAIISEGLSDGS